MYIVTFYSYKGGVGRSQALMNVASALAMRGRRVLIVDFDLEAPGLHSYRPFADKLVSKGIVEFVNEYLDSSASPDVHSYLIESAHIGSGKTFWLMPAGCQDSGYSARLSRIEWNDLYTRHQGYLLFEDLKQQWRDVVEPDYVLIDSRTGHTDVGGICTRQLPDAVVAMMMPNHQNIEGMRQIIQDIRADEELTGPVRKVIHFVFSNVPDLDDEADVLGRLTRVAGQQLGFTTETARIHHYASLDLLDQVIHTLDRPRTSLAGEYRGLVDQIILENAQDRDGALAWLSKMPPRGSALPWTDLNDRIEKILIEHGADAEVLAAAASLRMRMDDLAISSELFKAAHANGNREPETFLRHAAVLRLLERNDEAASMLQEVLKSPESDSRQTLRALKQLAKLSLSSSTELSVLPNGLGSYAAIAALNAANRVEGADILLSASRPEAARALLDSCLSDSMSGRSDAHLDNLAVAAIGSGAWAQAAEILRRKHLSEFDIHDAFNLGMAMWAETGKPDHSLFKRVIEFDQANQESPGARGGANYHQCLAIALALTGNFAEARRRLSDASRKAERSRAEQFSAWRYHHVALPEFLSDNREIEKLCNGELVSPKFFANRI